MTPGITPRAFGYNVKVFVLFPSALLRVNSHAQGSIRSFSSRSHFALVSHRVNSPKEITLRYLMGQAKLSVNSQKIAFSVWRTAWRKT